MKLPISLPARTAAFAAIAAVFFALSGCPNPAGIDGGSNRVETPAADPPAGAVGAGTRLTLSTATRGAEIYYTTDGTAPDSAAAKYTEAILITGALSIRAIAVLEGMEASAVLEAAYVIDPNTAAAPAPNYPAGAALPPGASIELTTATEGAEIYYATDGAAPDTLYTDPIPVDRGLVLRAIAVKEGLKPSALLEAAYTLLPAAAKPAADPAPGAMARDTPVILTTATEGAEIYYTTDGTPPDNTKTRYTDPIVITADLVIKAIAAKQGLADSAVLEAAYANARAAAPGADPAPGAMARDTPVILTT
ncbi:MAG: chitobiase/beta-hexosaminidase C-terminal domain-containing protein, partial [Treponema sp.]|nr:chitobiase/beta-hexosaminidase C-terminal domain-containing protein [Treponema sp.]